MEFEIEFYKDNKGENQIEKFLDHIKVSNNNLWSKAVKGIEKLKNKIYHTEPLSKHLESDLWELRIKSGNDILRIIYTFRKGKIIILLHAFIKKKQKTPINELEIARQRLKEIKLREMN